MHDLTKQLVFGTNYEGIDVFESGKNFYLDLKDLSKDELPAFVHEIAEIVEHNGYCHPGFVFKHIGDEYIENMTEWFTVSRMKEDDLVKTGTTQAEQKFSKDAISGLSTVLMTAEGVGVYTAKDKEIAVDALYLLLQIEISNRAGLCRAVHKNFSVLEVNQVLFEPVEPS